MAVMNVSPTRMELTRLKKKLVSLRRGHKILKDKRDELMRQFLLLVNENKKLRIEVEKAIKKSSEHMSLALCTMSREETDVALMMPTQKVELEIEKKTVMSVETPKYKMNFKSPDEADIYSYGFAFTSGELDESIKVLSEALPDMLRLAEVEKSCQLLSAEIEKTRRRVNALEYVLIPDHEETIRYISMKLDENERSNTARLMKIKDLMIQDSRAYI